MLFSFARIIQCGFSTTRIPLLPAGVAAGVAVLLSSLEHEANAMVITAAIAIDLNFMFVVFYLFRTQK